MNWSIAFGDYELLMNRRTLVYRLTETKTGTVWAEGLSLGWMEIAERETGVVTRHDFGAMRQVSVSEKAGPQGKRVLFGLDCEGIPVDIYLICSQREIQIQVEATRDTRTHLVHGFGLLPGLCAVPDNDTDYVFFPQREATYRLRGLEAAPFAVSRFRVWDEVRAPFAGAVRELKQGETSALALMTDSAYAVFVREQGGISIEYERDPERRRLDLRVVVLPDSDAISVARTYREKVIGEKNHVTLRKKMRERPALAQQIEQPQLLPVPSPPPLLTADEEDATRWDMMDTCLQQFTETGTKGQLVLETGVGDWAAVAVDGWLIETSDIHEMPPPSPPRLPLFAAIYRDSVMPLYWFDDKAEPNRVLRALLSLALPVYNGEFPLPSCLQQTCALLLPLYCLTFSAFLTAHRFLTSNFLVEEAIYSDKTRVVINQSETATYETEEFVIPPLGFYVRHAKMVTHDALRVGAETFPTRAWRITQSADGQPLATSTDIRTQEFPA